MNMDVEALTRMENFAKEVLKLTPEQRDAFFQEMAASGILTAEEANGLASYVCHYRLFTDGRYYKAVKQTVSEMLYHSFNNK